MAYVDGNNVSFICNLQQSPRLLELCGGGKIEKVWGTFSTFLFYGVLSHSHYLWSFLKNKSANLFAFLQNVVY